MTTKKPWTFDVRASGELVINLFELIGQDSWTGEGTTAKMFADDLKAAGNVRQIRLKVNSQGGSFFEGLSIFNLLLGTGARITAEVVGLAASIASVLIMAAEKIQMNENSFLMIHSPYTTMVGNAAEMRKMASTLDKVELASVSAYQRHTSKSAAEIQSMLAEETWMNAQEAIDKGFAEEIITSDAGDRAIAARALDLSKFRHVPPQVSARLKGEPAKRELITVSADERDRLRLRLEFLKRL
jgi:ATP-dependent Clp protease, protease subunit